MEFNEALKSCMKESGITAGELAKRSGLSPSVISRYRSGERKPTADSENIRLISSAISSYAKGNQKLDDKAKESLSEPAVMERLLSSLGLTVILEQSANPKKEAKEINTEAPADISGFLSALSDFHLQKYLRVLKNDMAKYLNSAGGHLKPGSTCAGCDGIRSGLSALIWESGRNSASPFVCYTDSITGGLPSYPVESKLRLEASVIHALQNGVRITRIDTSKSGSADSVSILKDSLPFMMAGGYCLSYDNSPNPAHPSFAALSNDAVLVGQAGGYDESFYYAVPSFDNAALTYQWNQFRDIMEKSGIAVRSFRRSDKNEYLKLLMSKQPTRTLTIRANTLPIATIPDGMLDTILARNSILGDKLVRIKNFVAHERKHFAEIADSVGIDITVPEIKAADFTTSPLSLGLYDIFEGGIYRYTYDEYVSHLNVTKAFVKQHKKSRLSTESAVKYPHLTITDYADDLITIAKDHAPASVLVICDPVLCDSIRRA